MILLEVQFKMKQNSRNIFLFHFFPELIAYYLDGRVEKAKRTN